MVTKKIGVQPDITVIVWELAMVLNEMVCKSEQVGLAIMLEKCNCVARFLVPRARHHNGYL